MDRAKFCAAAVPILFSLLTAPFLHTHVKAEETRATQLSECQFAVVHVHFAGELGASASENDCPSDLDHALNEPKPFVLVALITLQSPTLFIEMGNYSVALPGFLLPLIAPLERVSLTASPAIHDPPGPRRVSLRAPPPEYFA
jgi:hypothetical protein